MVQMCLFDFKIRRRLQSGSHFIHNMNQDYVNVSDTIIFSSLAIINIYYLLLNFKEIITTKETHVNVFSVPKLCKF